MCHSSSKARRKEDVPDLEAGRRSEVTIGANSAGAGVTRIRPGPSPKAWTIGGPGYVGPPLDGQQP
eukprot:3970284-Pyramimonas_sp.AAC.1